MNNEIEMYKELLSHIIDSHRQELVNISNYIHSNPELAFKEYKSCEKLVNFLNNKGFNVKKNISGMETAFIAEYNKGKKYPVISILAEYDALPIGHACGHNLIASSAVGAGIAVKRLLEEHNIDGTVRIIGCPAEENGGGKIIHLENGVFDDVDIALLMHPTSGVSRVAGRCKSSHHLEITYKGKTAHASSHPEKGINALDAANLFFVALGLLRQQFEPDVTASGIILEGGETCGLIPDKTKVSCSIRSFYQRNLENAVKRVKNCGHAGAIATGCEIIIEEKAGYKGRIENYTLGDICKNNFKLLNEPVMDGMPEDFGGEDFGDVNRVIPGIMPYITLLPEKKISNHTEQFKDLSISRKSEDALILGAKVMAYTAADLFYDTSIIERAKLELYDMQKKGM